MTPEEYQAKISKKVSHFRAAFMNDTKWREVFSLIGETEVGVRFSTIWDSNFSQRQKIISPILNDEYVGDGCLVGGPLIYREILELRIARFEQRRDPRTGVSYQDESRSQRFLASLDELGRLPITIGDDEITLRAYE